MTLLAVYDMQAKKPTMPSNCMSETRTEIWLVICLDKTCIGHSLH